MKCEGCIIAEEIESERQTEEDFDRLYYVKTGKCVDCGIISTYAVKKKKAKKK